MKRIAIYTIILIPVILLAQTSSPTKGKNGIDLLWKARALQALERLEELADNPPKSLTKKIKYEMLLESAYALLLSKPETVVKRTALTTNYHLLFHFDDRGLDVLYTYDAKTQELLSVGIDRLPKNWRVAIPSRTAANPIHDYICITNIYEPNEPLMLFSLTNPFSNRVINKQP